MTERYLEAEVRQVPGVAIVDLRGEIDGFSEEELNAAYARASEGDPEVILLNFSDVHYINSTGIALIVGLLAKARASRQRLLACGLSDHYVEIFNITRLSDFMGIFSDEESALNDATVS